MRILPRNAWMMALMLGATTAMVLPARAGAELTVERIPRALGQQHSTWTHALVPASEWREAGVPASTGSRDRSSSFVAAPVPRSEFSLADVPQSRLTQTRQLLGELKARTTADGAIAVDLPGDVLFDFDKDELRSDALPVLNRIVSLLGNFPAREVAVNGHTDSKGDDTYNDALSQRRAESVRRYLSGHDQVQKRTYAVHGHGEKQPVAPNARSDGSDDPVGRQKNRRVEIALLPPR